MSREKDKAYERNALKMAQDHIDEALYVREGRRLKLRGKMLEIPFWSEEE